MKHEPQKKIEPVRPPTPEEIVESEHKAYHAKCMKMSGIAHAFIYRPHAGFANYAIVRLKLKDGKIEEVEEITQALGAGEARAKMEIKQAYEFEKMRVNYPGGHRHV